MTTQIISRKKAITTLGNIPGSRGGEPDTMQPARKLKRKLRPCGAKNARDRMGRLDLAECGTVNNSVSGSVVYKNAIGVTLEMDVRGLPEKGVKQIQIEKKQVKEAIDFRAKIIAHKSGTYLREIDRAVVKRMAEMLVVQGVAQDRLAAEMPYTGSDYVAAWYMWAKRIRHMKFKVAA